MPDARCCSCSSACWTSLTVSESGMRSWNSTRRKRCLKTPWMSLTMRGEGDVVSIFWLSVDVVLQGHSRGTAQGVQSLRKRRLYLICGSISECVLIIVDHVASRAHTKKGHENVSDDRRIFVVPVACTLFYWCPDTMLILEEIHCRMRSNDNKGQR
jgi:hypothetical protein